MGHRQARNILYYKSENKQVGNDWKFKNLHNNLITRPAKSASLKKYMKFLSSRKFYIWLQDKIMIWTPILALKTILLSRLS